MKKSYVAIVMALVICFAPSAYGGGIPVFDAVNMTNNITSHIEDIAKMVEQIQQLQMQYQQLQQTYAAMTGGRGLGSILNDPQHQNYLPDSWKGTYDSIRSGGYAGLTGNAQTIHNQNTVYDICSKMTGDQQMACQREMALAAQDRAYSGDAYEAAKARLGQIQGLMDQAGSSQDEKSILELNARLQAENAMIQNEQIKLQMYKMVADSEQRLAEQQRKEADYKYFSKRGLVDFKGVDLSKE